MEKLFFSFRKGLSVAILYTLAAMVGAWVLIGLALCLGPAMVAVFILPGPRRGVFTPAASGTRPGLAEFLRGFSRPRPIASTPDPIDTDPLEVEHSYQGREYVPKPFFSPTA